MTREAKEEGMGHLRKDDELMQRGANPRTGLMTPYVLGDAAADSLKESYIGGQKAKPKRGRERGGSGRWKQDDLGWKLVDEFTLTPVAPAVTQSIPSKWPCVPSRGPIEISRKEVGSGVSRRKGSGELVTAKRGGECLFMSGVVDDQALTSRSQQGFSSSADRKHKPKMTGQVSTVLEVPSFKASSSSLAYFQFLHPNDTANLTYSSVPYRRPQHLLPAHLRTLEINSDIGNICTDDASDASYKSLDWRQRPQVRRKNGATTIPKLNMDAMEPKRGYREKHFQPVIKGEMKIPSSCLKAEILQVNTNKAKTKIRTVATDEGEVTSKGECKNDISNEESINLEDKTSNVPVYPHQRYIKPCPKSFPNIASTHTEPCVETNDTTPELYRKSHYGNRRIKTDGNLDMKTKIETLGLNSGAVIRERRAVLQPPDEKDSNNQSLVSGNDGKGTPIQWRKLANDGYSDAKAEEVSTESMEHVDTLLKNLIQVKGWIVMINRIFEAWPKTENIHQQLSKSARHVLLTLQNSFAALEVLRMPCGRIDLYVVAIFELLLATFYSLILLNIIFLACRAVWHLAEVFFWILEFVDNGHHHCHQVVYFGIALWIIIVSAY